MLVGRFFCRLIRTGTLRVIDAYGRANEFGDGTQPGITIRLHDRTLHWRLFTRPSLAFGEAFMGGTLTIEEGTLYDFLDLIGRNLQAANCSAMTGPWDRLVPLFRRAQQYNPIPLARRNVRHHYDLSGTLYQLFLDADRHYSCAYFRQPDDDLERAQQRKCRHIAAKLQIRPGHRILDIGCGWGGLALYLAGDLGADVTGITLSAEQLNVAQARAASAGLSDRIRFQLCDYRQIGGTYDRIVSVGMFEHVGVGHYRAFFNALQTHLTDAGIALLHTIGRAEQPGGTNPWIRRYIFPGGYTPALSEIVSAVEPTSLWLTDVEVWRLHYAETLRQWRQRFLANRAQASALYDDRFCRMWEFYLAGCEVAFRYLRQCVFQLQFAKQQESLPLTRDYMFEDERALDTPLDTVLARTTDKAA